MNIDVFLTKTFKNEDLQNIVKNFSIRFNENVQKILHPCNIQTLETTHNSTNNSIFVEYTNVEEFLILKKKT